MRKPLTDEQKVQKAAYLAQWKAANPERVALHRARATTPEKKAAHRIMARLNYAEKMKDPAARKAHNERMANRRSALPGERTAIELIVAARARANKLDLPFDLDRHAAELRARIRLGVCELSGVALKVERGPKQANSASLDRIRPELGYVYSNIRVIAFALNAGLGNWGEDAFAEIAKAYLARRGA